MPGVPKKALSKENALKVNAKGYVLRTNPVKPSPYTISKISR